VPASAQSIEPDRSPVFKPHDPTGTAARRQAKADRLRGPIAKTAIEEARTVLAALIAQYPDGIPVPDLKTAHGVIYQRLEETWIDAIAGDYLVVQSKLAVIKALGHYLGIDAAIKTGQKQIEGKVDAAAIAQHLQELGLTIRMSDAERSEATPRTIINLDRPPPGGAGNALAVEPQISDPPLSPAENSQPPTSGR
jgi:hypothetical protein